MNLQKLIKEHDLYALFTQAEIGIEKESHRITVDQNQNAHLANTEHPKTFGNRTYHPYIQTDFAESQLELITPPQTDEKELTKFLTTVNEITLRNIPENEYVWPLSIPPHLPNEEEIKVAQLEDTKQKAYRQYLADKYGKHKQLFSGIHYNFGFTPELIEKISTLNNQTLAETKNDLYMKIARQFVRYQWLLVYLYGATPYIEEEYFHTINTYSKTNLPVPQLPVRNLRVSKYGYVNEEKIQISFNTLEEYIQTLEQHVKDKDLIEEKEFYSTVRLKGSPKVREFLEKGIQYLELRLFDLNPLSANGIEEKDIRFTHIFMMLMAWLEEENYTESIKIGKKITEEIALSNPFEKTQHIEEGKWLFTQMLDMAKQCNLPLQDIELIKQKLEELEKPELTLCAKLLGTTKNYSDLKTLGTQIAIKNKTQALEKPYQLSALAHMELSTQALISDAIQYGIEVEILDENDQFLKLKFKDHIEYVKNGNMTSKDTYISALIMENKVVTKKVLAEAGFNVPESIQCKTLEEAENTYPLIVGKPIVIKPKSTNFGLGISIFQNGIDNKQDFMKAAQIAFQEDKEIMIEDYLFGEEYRFFVIGEETKAVLSRIPANVTGNGKNTIKELVEEKNQNPLRGDGLSSPLKKINLGEIEKLHLKTQNLDENSVPKNGEKIFLRANSNISTGGDSVDFTDQTHKDYKKIAAQITKALGAQICGIDLIIPNIKEQTSPTNKYGIVEANYNPMMMMHIYPYEGTSRRLTTDVLKLLFPEKQWK